MASRAGYQFTLPTLNCRTSVNISSVAASGGGGGGDEGTSKNEDKQEHGTAGHPSAADCKEMAYNISSLPHEVLLVAAINGNHDAREEVLTRNIMAVDGIGWADAKEKVAEIETECKKWNWLARLPYQIGLIGFATAAIVSVPLVFHADTVNYFNEHFVTMPAAEEGEQDTWLEVGGFAWGWMEPPLGQASFMILCAQLSMGSAFALGFHTNGDWMGKNRATRVLAKYPHYNERVLREFASSEAILH